MKLTRTQLKAFAETLIIMNDRRRKAIYIQAKNPHYCEFVPLTKLYSRWNAKCRQAILCAVDCCFERVSRGNNLPEKNSASRWIPRKDNYMTTRLSKTLKELYEANKEHIVSVVRHTYHNREKARICVVTEFEFSSPEVEEVFASQIEELRLTEEDGKIKEWMRQT